MTDYERQFKKFAGRIEFDDAANHKHRDRLEQNLLVALAKQSRQKQQPLKIWRTIMNSRITKLTAVAAVLIIVAIIGWLFSIPEPSRQITSFTLLAQASAAEQKLFYGTGGITHIVNEIILYPQPLRNAGEPLNDLESNVSNETNIAFVKRWLSYRWIPVYSLAEDGDLREHKIDLIEHTNETVTVSDLAWFDPVSGQFARVLKAGDHVLFANAYDGASVYTASRGPDGLLKIEQEAVTDEFQVPENPADFLGIAAGITGSVPRKYYPPVQDVTTETLRDGTHVRIYKLGFKDIWGNLETYFLFRVSTNNNVIDEIECVVDGETSRIHRRLIAETVESPELSWDISELNTSPTGTGIAIGTEETANTVSIQQMVERSTSTVYVFSKDPSWTYDRKIYDLPDETSPPARFFPITYKAKDGRDIVLCQGESFNRYFTAVFGEVQERGEQVPWKYESENGFKVMHQNDKKTEMWWTEFALKSSGFEPNANRVGYILMSPTKTFMVLAINGPISNQELKGLVDSLIPADEYVTSPTQP